MPTYSHTWDSRHGWHTRVTPDEPLKGTQKWIHNRRLQSVFYAVTLNTTKAKLIETKGEAEIKEFLHSLFPKLPKKAQVLCVTVANQYEEVITWESEDELDIYCKYSSPAIGLLMHHHNLERMRG